MEKLKETETITLILIGGAARVGKTTLVRKLLKVLPYYTLSTDNLKYMARQVDGINNKTSSKDWSCTETWFKKVRNRDFATWQWVRHYIISSLNNNEPLIVEGNLWADYINASIDDFINANKKVKVITLFIVDKTPLKEATERLLNLKQDSYNWLNKYKDEQIPLFAKCNEFRTNKIAEFADKYCYLVYDINDYESMDKMQDVIISDITELIKN